MDKMITCINCPVGCRMQVTMSDRGEFLSVTGNTCARGAKYAEQECTLPVRTITAVIPVSGCDTPLSVRTSEPVPKHMIPQIMKVLSELTVSSRVAIGDVLVENILETGADIIATRNV